MKSSKKFSERSSWLNSHPVNAWNAGNARHFLSPKFSCNLVILIYVYEPPTCIQIFNLLFRHSMLPKYWNLNNKGARWHRNWLHIDTLCTILVSAYSCDEQGWTYIFFRMRFHDIVQDRQYWMHNFLNLSMNVWHLWLKVKNIYKN